MMAAAKAAGDARAEADKEGKKEKAKAKAEAGAPVKAEAAEHADTKERVMKKPSMGRKYRIEWSRNQIVCDTGIQGANRYTTLSFKAHGGVENTKRKADLWRSTGEF